MSNFFKKIGAKEAGFDLIEIVVATGIISIALVAVIAIASRSLALSHRSLDVYTASTLLEEGAESVRVVRDDAWSNISSLTSGTTYYPKFDSSTNTWSMSTNSADGVVGIFTRSVVLADVVRDGSDDIATSGTTDAGTKFVTVSVSWKGSDGATLTRSLPLYVTNIF